ncbi:hypothetical protein [Pseudoduganella sp. HUAS MS19]
MDPTIFQKFKDSWAAFSAGILIGVALTWQVASTLNKREVDILERQVTDYQRRVQEKDAQLQVAQQATIAALAKIPSVAPAVRKAELEALINKLDVEIKNRMAARAAASPMREGEPKGDLYIQIEQEIESLRNQRNEARQKLMQLVAG